MPLPSWLSDNFDRFPFRPGSRGDIALRVPGAAYDELDELMLTPEEYPEAALDAAKAVGNAATRAYDYLDGDPTDESQAPPAIQRPQNIAEAALNTATAAERQESALAKADEEQRAAAAPKPKPTSSLVTDALTTPAAKAAFDDGIAVDALRERQFRMPQAAAVDEHGWDGANRAAAERLVRSEGLGNTLSSVASRKLDFALPGSAAQRAIDNRLQDDIRRRHTAAMESIRKEGEANDPMRRSIEARKRTLDYERLQPSGSQSSMQATDRTRGIAGDALQMNDWDGDGRGEIGGPTIGEDMQFGRAMEQKRADQWGKERVATAATRETLEAAADIEEQYQERVARVKASSLPKAEKDARIAAMAARRLTLLRALKIVKPEEEFAAADADAD